MHIGFVEITVPDIEPGDDYQVVRAYFKSSSPMISPLLIDQCFTSPVQSLAILGISALSSVLPNPLLKCEDSVLNRLGEPVIGDHMDYSRMDIIYNLV